MKYKSEFKFAKHLIKLARQEIMPHFQSNLKIDIKTDNSPVTIADKNAEEAMRTAIEKETPQYGIIGEEFGDKNGKVTHQWVIDPIDGTKSFIHGVPLFGTLLALMKGDQPILGFIALHALNIVVWAIKDQGCYVNEQLCHVSNVHSLSKATLLDGSTTTMEKMNFSEPWKKLRSQAELARGWGDCFGYYLVATGKAEVMADPIAEVWDLAPMSIIIPEAGGIFSSITGGNYRLDKSGLATNGLFHQNIVNTFTAYQKTSI